MLSSLAPVPDCQAIGFPYAQRDASGGLDTEQLTGTYKPGSGLLGGRDVLAVDGTPPAPRPDGLSPWAGMSGAAVFAGDVLIGVVTTDPTGWQHGRVTVTLLQRPYDGTGLRSVLSQQGFTPLFVPPPGQLIDPRSTFEARYAPYLVKRHGTLRIFGIDLTDRKRATWPLDAAYYSLEATPTADPAMEDLAPRAHRPLPAEQALAGHDRVLLRGVAGSGKTTLVQWLAVATARQDLGEHLEHLRGLVPYVLPLRTIARRDRLPAPADFLSAVEVPLSPPSHWAEDVLAERRGLVLIDGLDEIDERSRERVGDWLRGLLAAYPGNRWLVTSRPTAVSDSWLADEGFTDLTLSPMSRGDIRAFSERWHDAARASVPDEEPEERARLDTYQRTLLDALHTKQDLARLATNPLMCGLICALHRDRSGYLPTGRKELYDAALGMLLIRRDRERDLATPLTEEPQIQLLQKLAYWLVKNGQAEMDISDAMRLISAALPAMPSAAALGDSASVYCHLRDRSGLLREPTPDTVDFIHRTFQDFLAARAAVEDLDFDLLAANAHHDQWADVIRMAVAHGRPAERARLLRKLIERGDAEPDHSARLHLLATACLEHATELDPRVRAEVVHRAERLIPPRTAEDVQGLVSVGPLVLETASGPGKAEPRRGFGRRRGGVVHRWRRRGRSAGSVRSSRPPSWKRVAPGTPARSTWRRSRPFPL
ncbi:NACHT domain-containing protein [Streptomyces sp. NPDC003300]|uniref:NACHT domain-containing protein n=1 Tax=unclassified Streptomyces TaxID=2593676 RepID=UPI0033B428D8